MVYSHISHISPTGAYSYYETRRTPFRAPPGTGDIEVLSRSSELTPSGEARRHRSYNYRSTDSSSTGPYNHKIETWVEPVAPSARSRASSCSRAFSRRSLSRNRDEGSTTRADRLLQENPLWNRTETRRSISRGRDQIERDPNWMKLQVASIKNDIGNFFEKADHKLENQREKDYRSTWVKDEMSSLKNDITGFQNYVSSPRSDVKRLEDRLNVEKVQYEVTPPPRCVDCGRRSQSVSRFPLFL